MKKLFLGKTMKTCEILNEMLKFHLLVRPDRTTMQIRVQHYNCVGEQEKRIRRIEMSINCFLITQAVLPSKLFQDFLDFLRLALLNGLTN